MMVLSSFVDRSFKAKWAEETGVMGSTKKTWGIGYSCVLFAWMSFCACSDPQDVISVFGVRIPSIVFTIPWTAVTLGRGEGVTSSIRISVYPFLLLLLTKLLIPNSSFLGHLAGLLIGYCLSCVVSVAFSLRRSTRSSRLWTTA